MGLHYKGLTCKSAVILIFALLVLVIGLSLLAQYLTWWTWSRSQYHTTTCTEKVYNFEDRRRFSSGIYTDKGLIESCKAIEDISQLPYKQHSPTHDMRGYSKSPDILTTCGLVTPTLISLNNHTTHDYINSNIEFIVPNIVHYIFFDRQNFSFSNYLSFKSVDKYIKPEYIYIHGNGLPRGYWWNKTTNEINNLYHVYRDVPNKIQGWEPSWMGRKTDVVRLQTLLDNGGIYLDNDVLVLKPLDDLRKNTITVEHESNMGNGIIIAAPYAPHICILLHGYRTYNPWPWNWETLNTRDKLVRVMPDYIHIAGDSFLRTPQKGTDLLLRERIKWKKRYAMHIGKRHGHVPENPNEILQLSTTIAEAMRFVYYGSPETKNAL